MSYEAHPDRAECKERLLGEQNKALRIGVKADALDAMSAMAVDLCCKAKAHVHYCVGALALAVQAWCWGKEDGGV